MTVLIKDGWQMQWHRVERGFAKLNEAYNNTELYDDDIYHFFQDAWHLKDWIKNDPAVSKNIRDHVENKVAGVKALRIAADFANGTKHLKLTRPRAEDAKFTERNVYVKLGCQDAAIQERILTLADGSKTSAELVAKDVMQEWKELLQQFGLIT